jgi:uncharacterized membrane protein YeaQ/YmgE (transglycosylase-associated protein family)
MWPLPGIVVTRWVKDTQGTGLGIVFAFIGGFVLSLLLPGTFGLTGFNLGSLIVAFIGAVILLFIVKPSTGRRAVS